MLSVERLVLVLFDGLNEHAIYAYVLRLLAYSLILYAVVEKNTGRIQEVISGS